MIRAGAALMKSTLACGFSRLSGGGRERMASSSSRRLSSSTGSPISYRRRASTGIGITASLRRITSSGPPSRRMTKGNIGKRREAVTGGHAAGGRATGGCCDANPNQKPRSHDTSRIAWAKLMARVGEEFPLECPNCGGDIRLIAFITKPGPIRKILTPVLLHTQWRTARAATGVARSWPAADSAGTRQTPWGWFARA
jgi:hypothetical protein